MKVNYFMKPSELLDAAFGKARKEAPTIKKSKNKLKARKQIEETKIKLACEYLNKKLHGYVTDFPNIDELHPFYRENMEYLVDINKVKKSLAQLDKVSKIIKKLRFTSVKNVYKTETEKEAKDATSACFGRVSSLIDSLEKSLDYLNHTRRLVTELPSIKFDIPTVILAGYPNTGKTTLLNRLTGSTAKTASYSFTTKELRLGYFTQKYHEIQVVDTPGLLDRPESKRNNIEKKATSALKHLANVVVFVFDPTEHSGYSLEKQMNLFKEIKKQFKNIPFVVVLNKGDIANKEQLNAVKVKVPIVVEGEKIQSNIKEIILENLITGVKNA